MKKRLLGILLSFVLTLAMVVGLMPGMSLTALASVSISGLWVGNSDEVKGAGTITNTGGSGTASVSVEDGSIVLELDNFSYNGQGHGEKDQKAPIFYNGSTQLIVRLTGTNIITQNGAEGGNSNGLFSSGTNEVRIEGPGSLTITSGNALNSSGINTGAGVTFKDCTVQATGGNSSNTYSATSGVRANGNITVDSANLTVIGGTGTGHSRGVMASKKNLIVKSGTVTAKGNESAFYYGDSVYKTSLQIDNGSTLTELKAGENESSAQQIALSNVTNQKYIYAAVTAPAHTHNFTYSASGSTITAACSADDCPLPESSSGAGDHVATLTIAAPESLAYDGNPKAATITDENMIQGSAKVKYAKKTGESSYDTETETAPTDAGTYKASITLGEGDGAKTASVEYTITATPLTITGATLTERDYVKDKKDVAVTAVAFDGGTPTLGTDFTATAVMADDTAGDSKAVTVTVTLSNTNYSLATNTYQTTVKINKATPATPATPTAASKTDTSVTLTATDGYQYKRDGGEGWQDSNIFTGLTEDTSYNFYQRVKGDDNHKDSDASDPLTIRTNQEPIDYAVVSKSGNKLIITIKTLTEYIKAKTTNSTVWLKDGDFLVVKENATLNNGLVYSGNVGIVLCDGATLTIRGGIWHYGSELTIYGQEGQSGQIVVNGNNSITLDNVPEGKDASQVSKDSALDGGKININGGKLSVTPGPGQDVCGANAKVTFLSNVSLTGTTTGGEVTLTEGTYGPTELNRFTTFVTKGSAIVKTEPAAKSLTENGSAQQLVTAGEAEHGTMQYALGKDATTVPTSGWGEAIPTGTNAGTYYVWYKAKGDETHGDSLPVCVTVTIAKKTDPAPTPTPIPATASVTINSKTVSASTLAAAYAKAGVNPDSVATVVLGKKVKKIKKGSFQNLRNANTLVVKSKKLTKARVKGSLKGSSITKVKVKVGKKKTNKYYAKRYKKIFTKKNCGKKVRISR